MKYYNYLPITLLFVTASCSDNQTNNQAETAAPVSVTELKLGSISKYINTTGTALPISETEIKTETAGMYRLQTNPATGRPFKLGDKVKAGDLLISFDMEKIIASGYKTTTMVVVSNAEEFGTMSGEASGNVKVGDKLFVIGQGEN